MSRHPRWLLGVLALGGGCRDACRERTPEPALSPPEAPPAREVSARCAAEVANASVVTPPGTGDIDALSVGCREGTLGVFILRGHVLSWTARAAAQGEAFSRPVVVSTGADRLGPVAADAPEGPVAWRSPVAGLDVSERDDVWGATVTRADGGASARRGDAVLPEGVLGLGVPFARMERGALRVMAAVAREGVAPSTVSLDLTLGRESPAQVTALPAGDAGQIEAWEPARDVTLSRVEEGGVAYLEARFARGGRARYRVSAPEVVVVPRGAATEAGAVFLVGEFAVGRGDGGACVGAPGGICVRPGRVSLLVARAGEDALRAIEVAPRGIPDALAAEGRTVTALYVEPGDGEATTQRAARVDALTGAREALDLAPPQGFPAIDSPQLARCGEDLWLVAAIAQGGGTVDRTAVTALPLACLLR